MSELGRLLKQLRGRESLRDISRKAGISHTYLSIIEKGSDPRSGNPIKPTPETLKLLSDTYKYPYEEFMRIAGYLKESSNDYIVYTQEDMLSEEHTVELEKVLLRADLVFKGKGLNEQERKRIFDMLTLLFHESVEIEKKEENSDELY